MHRCASTVVPLGKAFETGTDGQDAWHFWRHWGLWIPQCMDIFKAEEESTKSGEVMVQGMCARGLNTTTCDRDGDGTVTVEEEFVVFYYDVRSGNAMPFHKKYLAFKQW